LAKVQAANNNNRNQVKAAAKKADGYRDSLNRFEVHVID
jgi:hypothetical protein